MSQPALSSTTCNQHMLVTRLATPVLGVRWNLIGLLTLLNVCIAQERQETVHWPARHAAHGCAQYR